MKHLLALFLGAALLAAGCGSGHERVTAGSAVAPQSAPGNEITPTTPVTETIVYGSDQTTLPPTTAAPASTTSTARPALTVEARSPDGRRVDPAEGEVLLWVSNQSFEDDTVSLTVAIDGQPAVDRDFEVENQHNWIGFFLRGLPPGEHTVTARSDTGVDFEGSFTLPPGKPRWLVLDYWFDRDDPEGRHFTLSEHNQAVMFM